jgi:UDP-glucose 4-epimerase
MEKIIVIGGAGFIGSHLVKALKGRIFIADLKVPPFVSSSCCNDLGAYIKRIKPTTIFNLAALPLYRSIDEPFYVTYKMYNMGISICELLRTKYFKNLIHISSSEVFSINTPYAAAKDAQDKLIQSYVRTFGVHAKIARPFNTYGPGQTLNAVIPVTIQRILKNQRPIITGDGEQKRDLIYVEDTVKGIIDVWKNKKEGEYNISSGKCYTINEVVETINRLMDYKGKPIYTKARKGDTPIIHGETTIKNCVSLEEGLKRTIKWWREKDSM